MALFGFVRFGHDVSIDTHLLTRSQIEDILSRFVLAISCEVSRTFAVVWSGAWAAWLTPDGW